MEKIPRDRNKIKNVEGTKTSVNFGQIDKLENNGLQNGCFFFLNQTLI